MILCAGRISPQREGQRIKRRRSGMGFDVWRGNG